MLSLLSLLSFSSLGLGAPILTSSCPFALDTSDHTGGIRYVTNYRSTAEIIWTCLVTTCLCTWVSMHPDILGYNFSGRDRVRVRVAMFLVAFVAPEVTLLFAAAQWKVAHDIVCRFGDRTSLEKRAWKFVATDSGSSAKKQEENCRKAHDNGGPKWQMMHGHFLLMGGVMFSVQGHPQYLELKELLRDDDPSGNQTNDNKANADEQKSDEANTDEQKSNEASSNEGNGQNLVDGAKTDTIDKAPEALADPSRSQNMDIRDRSKFAEAITPMDEVTKYRLAREELEKLPGRNIEIRDRSKADMITKTLTFLQTIWFIVHLAVRKAQNLDVTALEVITLAYAITTIFVYVFWKDKPLHVQNPIVIPLDGIPLVDDVTKTGASESSRTPHPVQHDGAYLGCFIALEDLVNAVRQILCKPKAANPPEPEHKPYLNIGYAFVPLAQVILGVPGSIYYIAWNFTFPKFPLGRILWRVTCVVGTSIPIFFTGSAVLLVGLGMVTGLVLGPILFTLGKLEKGRGKLVEWQKRRGTYLSTLSRGDLPTPTRGDPSTPLRSDPPTLGPRVRFQNIVRTAVIKQERERELEREMELERELERELMREQEHWTKKVGSVVVLLVALGLAAGLALGPMLFLLRKWAEWWQKLRGTYPKVPDPSTAPKSDPQPRLVQVAKEAQMRAQVRARVRERVQERARVRAEEEKEKRKGENWLETIVRVIRGIVPIFIIACFWVCYFSARLILVSLALWSLYDLPADAHQTVAWARFIPHF